ncbi:PREDICTED: coiled-coil domain-containing protein 151 [Nanorana parkeri]|uniref:coiled-coil domain-containing protein 151 n=1 Tax=Nanorana parkeri TaxID=125878 RepID=UPI0008541721|nr:PREDICTED: coiled-coil domain-containing protein 151 [Nanorana parkeri]
MMQRSVVDMGCRVVGREISHWLCADLPLIEADFPDMLVPAHTGDRHSRNPRSHFPAKDLSPQSDEYVLDLLDTTEKKLQKLLEELEGQDIAAVLRQMEEDEFQAKIEGKLPAYNVRIALPAPTKQEAFEDEEDSGEDEGDVVTRAALKRQSQQIVESKTKRKSRPKKKKGKQ